MTRCVSLLAILLFAIFITSGYGSRQLQSVTLKPASADAKNFPNGEVSFTATGTFSRPPSPVQLNGGEVQWCIGDGSTGACAGNVVPNATVDQNGVAQCRSGFAGTATVLAGTSSNAMMMPDVGPQLKVFGSAQLTCP
jgi:hypothetical protein